MKSSAIKALAIITLIAGACKEPKQQQPEKTEQQPKKEYLPVTDYIRSEIKAVDSLPVGILKRVSVANRSDSGFITPEEFKRLAQEFLPKELEKETFERSFTESSFMDQTTETLTFAYAASNPKSELRRVDVLVAPSLQLDKIKSIYMEKAYSSGDTSIIKKMYWKAGSNFNIITQRTLAQKPEEIEQVKVIWDPSNY